MLTEKGKVQAAIVGKRLLNTPIDGIVTSSFQRAIDTGNIIAVRINKPVIGALDTLVEYESPHIQMVCRMTMMGTKKWSVP